MVRGLYERLQTLKTAWKFRGARNFVVVHTMARVGSVSVIRALVEQVPEHHYFHTHYLRPDTIDRFYEGFTRVYRVTGRMGRYEEHREACYVRRGLCRRGAGFGFDRAGAESGRAWRFAPAVVRRCRA